MKTLIISIIIILNSSICYTQDESTEAITISIFEDKENTFTLNITSGKAVYTSTSTLSFINPTNSFYNCYLSGTKCDINIQNNYKLFNPTEDITFIIVKSRPDEITTINAYNPILQKNYEGELLSDKCLEIYKNAQDEEYETTWLFRKTCAFVIVAEYVVKMIWGINDWMEQNVFSNIEDKFPNTSNDLSGKWIGILDQNPEASKRKDYSAYYKDGTFIIGTSTHILELSFEQNGSDINGIYHIKLSTDTTNFGKFKISGNYYNNFLYYKTTSLIESFGKTSFCYNESTLEYLVKYGDEYLEGNWKGWYYGGDCASAWVSVRRIK